MSAGETIEAFLKTNKRSSNYIFQRLLVYLLNNVNTFELTLTLYTRIYITTLHIITLNCKMMNHWYNRDLTVNKIHTLKQQSEYQLIVKQKITPIVSMSALSLN